MRIIFFGSGDFATPSLKSIMESDKVDLVAVVTQPDRKGGRGLNLKTTEVKSFLEHAKYKGPILQPQDVNELRVVNEIGSFNADLFIVTCYGQILNTELLKLPRVFALNIHASLLPKYRGAAPINWAIIRNEKITGVTIFKMNEYMDAGEIILQRKVKIEQDCNSIILEKSLSEVAVGLLKEVLGLIRDDKCKFIAQKDKAFYAPKLRKKDGLIEWNKDAFCIVNRIRGLQPWPCAYTLLDSKILKIYSAAVCSTTKDAKCGYIVEIGKEVMKVSCSKGTIDIYEVQIEGKKRMSVKEFLSGHRVNCGVKLGA